MNSFDRQHNLHVDPDRENTRALLMNRGKTPEENSAKAHQDLSGEFAPRERKVGLPGTNQLWL